MTYLTFLSIQSAGGMNISEDNDGSKSAVSATTVDTPKSTTLPPVVDAQLQRLSAVLASRLSSQRKRTRDSVPSHNSDPRMYYNMKVSSLSVQILAMTVGINSRRDVQQL